MWLAAHRAQSGAILSPKKTPNVTVLLLTAQNCFNQKFTKHSALKLPVLLFPPGIYGCFEFLQTKRAEAPKFTAKNKVTSTTTVRTGRVGRSEFCVESAQCCCIDTAIMPMDLS